MNSPVACVIGDLSLIRALGRAGIPVALVTFGADASAARSRYCKRLILVPSFVDEEEAAVRVLEEYGAHEESPPVLFYQGDHDLLAVSRHRERLARRFRLLLPPKELVEDLVDKLRFATLAERLGLPAPMTWTLERNRPESFERLRAWRLFPCIVKPATRAHWFGSTLQERMIGTTQKAIRVASAEHLEALMPLLSQHGTDFVIQEAVPGGEECILSYHAYVRQDGDIVAEFTGRKLRTHPRTYGLSTCVEITDDPRVKREGREVLARLGFFGVVKLDFKQHPNTGQLYLLEANPRFNLWHHPGAVAGVNIPALVYHDLVHPEALSEPVGAPQVGVRWAAGRGDIRAMLEYRAAGEISFGEWARQFFGADIIEEMLASDPVPGLLEGLATLRRAGRRALSVAAHSLTGRSLLHLPHLASLRFAKHVQREHPKLTPLH